MIAGLLALMLVTADTARVAPPVPEMLTQRSAVVFDTLIVTTPLIVVAGDTLTAVKPAPLADLATGLDSVDAGPRFFIPRADTVVKKKKILVDYSDWYGRRLAVHRYLTWAMIPLFATSYYTGERLARDGRIGSPYIIRALHPYAATGASVVFGVNTLTGLWNLWDARHDPEGRTRRIIHSVLFMVADGGFAWAGSMGKQARDDSAIRDKHRTIALSSMGVSYFSMMLMLIGGK
jgi:hypothetical protein